jgi:hypothetical protein
VIDEAEAAAATAADDELSGTSSNDG